VKQNGMKFKEEYVESMNIGKDQQTQEAKTEEAINYFHQLFHGYV
jgi:hypothetical protein